MKHKPHIKKNSIFLYIQSTLFLVSGREEGKEEKVKNFKEREREQLFLIVFKVLANFPIFFSIHLTIFIYLIHQSRPIFRSEEKSMKSMKLM